jgi:membrane fusion protein
VQPGQAVLSLLPAGARLEAHLVVPSRAVGFIAPGDAVRLRYQAFPYQKFGHHRGEVARISRSALSAAELPSLTGLAAAGEPAYRVVVALDRDSVRAFGKDEPLRPGMRLDADILGEQRKLWEWLFEPLHALSGAMGAGQAAPPAPAGP